MSEIWDEVMQTLKVAEEDIFTAVQGDWLPPFLGLVAYRGGLWGMHLLPDIPDELPLHDFLERLEGFFQSDPDRPRKWVEIAVNPIALAVFAEGRAVKVDEATADRLVSQGMPGIEAGVEPITVRLVFAVDFYGQSYMIQRMPGEQEVTTSDTPTGPIYHSLRAIVRTMVAVTPDNQEFLDALETSFVPSYQDAKAIAKARQEHHRRSRPQDG